MTVRTVTIMGAPSLLETSKPIEDFSIDYQPLVSDMFDTMRQEDGAGLAAPQIGINRRIIVFGFDHCKRYPGRDPIPVTVLINPTYEVLSDDMEDGWEGCLSVPGLRGLVSRYQHIRYQGYDERGQLIQREVSGFHARLIQHEVDHLDGLLYPFRIKDLRQFGFEDALVL